MTITRYLKELPAALAAYGVVLIGSIALLDAAPSDSRWRLAIALAPMLGCVGVLWVILRQIRRFDELQRRIQLDALAFAFAGTAFLTFGYGFLEGEGYPRLTMFAVWPVMASLWVIGLVAAARRYR